MQKISQDFSLTLETCRIAVSHCFISHTFENNVILPTDYNIISMKQMLDNGILQNNFRVIISPGDGFCLLHSLSLSLKSQFPDSHAISINELINCLKKEAILHKERYLSAFGNNSSNSLLHGLSEYINNRVYDSVFGDIVPHAVTGRFSWDWYLYSLQRWTVVETYSC